MAFEKGREKTGGRKSGSTNRVTTDIKTRIATLVSERFDSINNDLDELEPKDRVTAFLKFLEYALPKQREQKLDLSTLNDEQIDDLLNRAIAKQDSRHETSG